MSTDRQSPKIVLVTGASSGIGEAIAREAAEKGYRLALTARRGDRLAALADRSEGALVIPADLADTEAPGRIIARIIDHFGRLDVLINNAGIGLPGLFGESEPEELRRQIEINLVAPVMLTRIALPYLIESRGMVINVGSAIRELPNPALGVYGTTKAALAYWNDALRRELRHKGVRVCLVDAGPVKTEFFEAIDVPAAPSIFEYNPIEQPPPGFLTGKASDLARKIVRLIERPGRRLASPRRAVWPFRAMGAIFGAWPWLGDVAISSIVRHFDQNQAESRADADVSARL